MNIWKKNFSLESVNNSCIDTAVEYLGIKITDIGENTIEGEMPIDNRTCQVRRLLHGGASALLVETLGSIGGYLSTSENYTIAGIEVNANHIGGISNGYVVGVATAVHIGRTTHVWDVKINEKNTARPICVGRLTLAVIDLNI
ncbi:MAG: esterase [Arcobacter sp.]|nr:MAG: esterase [Arcobacter sp.]